MFSMVIAAFASSQSWNLCLSHKFHAAAWKFQCLLIQGSTQQWRTWCIVLLNHRTDKLITSSFWSWSFVLFYTQLCHRLSCQRVLDVVSQHCQLMSGAGDVFSSWLTLRIVRQSSTDRLSGWVSSGFPGSLLFFLVFLRRDLPSSLYFGRRCNILVPTRWGF